MTELEKAVAMDTALYDEIESLLPKDGAIDDTCSLINEIMYLIKRREMSAKPRSERRCATCHAILADGPQPAATYPRSAHKENMNGNK